MICCCEELRSVDQTGVRWLGNLESVGLIAFKRLSSSATNAMEDIRICGSTASSWMSNDVEEAFPLATVPNHILSSFDLSCVLCGGE